MKDTPVSAIMTHPVVTINVHSTLDEAEKLMRRQKIRHLPVVKSQRLVGIISLTDLQRLSFADNFGDEEIDADVAVYNMFRVRHVMVAHPTTIHIKQTIYDAAKILAEHEFHALPVVDGESVVGIVTTTDLIRYFLEKMA